MLLRNSTSSRGAFSSSREDDEESLIWAALERLPTYDRLNKGILLCRDPEAPAVEEVDVRKLSLQDRQRILDKLLAVPEEDNEELLLRLRERIDRVGIEVPKIEVKFQQLSVQAKVHVGARALPTLPNFVSNILEGILGVLHFSPSKRTCFSILRDASGVVKPSRMTLLLGPPGSGKTTFLLALAGKLDKSLTTSGQVTYNGHNMSEFVPQRTCAYISQQDLHYGEMTVRETLDFSVRCQGSVTRYDMLSELSRREKNLGIKPDSDIDIFMKGTSMQGQEENLTSDYIMKLLALDICSDVIVGDVMRRGISGGQKKRVTTAEMLVGPAKAMFMDEVSTGLDTSTTFQIIKCLQQFVHIMSGTMVISLLQPAPETFALFDDLILLSEGQIVYHGPCDLALEFFESQGFKCPQRKGAADFLQEVTSRKDQGQYWTGEKSSYEYVSVSDFRSAFQKFHVGERLRDELEKTFDKSSSHPAALVTQKYASSGWDLFQACLAREMLLMKRNSFVYIFTQFQLLIVATITMTVFLRTEMKHETVQDGILYLGSLFLGLLTGMFNGFAELAMVILRLPVFYKQRDMLFYPAWAYSLPMIIAKLPISLMETTIWVGLTYWVIGYAPETSRFFAQLLLFFVVNQMAQAFFRLTAAGGRTLITANTFGSFVVLLMVTLGGFIIGREDIHPWWIWGYWSSPLMYAQNAIAVNEFRASRWNKPSNVSHTVGEAVLVARGLFPQQEWYWIGLGAVAGFAVLFNAGFVLAMTYLNPFSEPQVVTQEIDTDSQKLSAEGIELQQTNAGGGLTQKGMILPFQPLSLAFHHINYFVDMPAEMKQQGMKEDRLQLLQDVSGVFRPGVLTALIGISGAGKTTLMDVLAGRKTGGCIEGIINISGHPKKQETFTRISGYCEQTDVHSPNLTIEESLAFSAWLRLPKEIDGTTRMMFVEEVLELVELTLLRNSLVGLAGVTGLSVEQRKRLTIAVELVANPSIIFMDEPTSGLDARAAAIVMRAVRNTVNTGRTVVCTIHQPSIDIFEAFDELLLMKRGGQLIYGGPLGKCSSTVIDYFQSIAGVPAIRDGYNPATWMLEITSQASETRLGVDFAQIYKESPQYRQTEQLIEELSTPVSDIPGLSFPTKYSQSFLMQCLICLWKQHWSYWRNPYYIVVRMFFTAVSGLLFGAIFWDLGSRREKQQDVFNLLGVLYSAVVFLGSSNALTIIPVVATERTVFYRERAAGMYSALPYALAQVLIEIPYTVLQSILYGFIMYSMIGFDWTLTKFLYFFFFSMAGFFYYTLYGMMAVALSPNEQVAAILAGFFFGVWNLFAGFLIPHQHIPIWWRWYYWLTPVAWTVQGLFASQLGDVETLLQIPDQPSIPVKKFIQDYFGFNHDFLGVIVTVHLVFIVAFAIVFAFCVKYLNFQRR